MKRVTRRDCNDAPIPEEQETEGQRRLHSLLVQQLDTGVDIDRCFAKKQCFAPAAFYKPFGEQAAGVKSLSQFQALQNKEIELASLRELGLTDAEIQLWKTKDTNVAVTPSPEKTRGVGADPAARRERLQVIQEKIDAHEQLLSRPQRLSASRPLSRREMEIERALFHGSDRQGFLTALYHQEEEPQVDQPGTSTSDSMHMLYKDFFKDAEKELPAEARSHQTYSAIGDDQLDSTHSLHTVSDESADRTRQSLSDVSQVCQSSPAGTDVHVDQSTAKDSSDCSPRTCDSQKSQSQTSRRRVDVSQSIGTLTSPVHHGSKAKGPINVTGQVEPIPEEEILQNKETDEGIRSIPRFHNYHAGQPSNVLCVRNLSPLATVAQLVSLFSRFQLADQPPILYRLLTGRLKGQAFITLSDKESAQAALNLLHGYRLLDKPLIIEFGREKKEDLKNKDSEKT